MQKQQLTLLLALLLALPLSLRSQPKIAFDVFNDNVTRPLDIAHCGDSRLFIVGQQGYIWILDSLGNRLPNAFLNIDARVRSSASEQGLLGLAFPPDYAQTGFFYVNYTRESDGATRVSRFSVRSDNPNEADPDSEEILLTQTQPYNNHNGGCLKFGPDGYLYISFGDGGAGGDPDNYGQTKNTLLGKILRIDVSTTGPGLPYAIPPDNPFVNDPAYRPEIWSLGWRNPWRFSFDRLTGDMWIGDVGQSTREEIDFEPANTPGLNYGWRCYEGNVDYQTSNCQPQSAYVDPVFDYDNSSLGRSVTGGFIYRGSVYPDLYGYYIFPDYASDRWWAIKQQPDNSFVTTQIRSPGNGSFAGLGEDVHGELYVADVVTGDIYKIRELCSAFQLSASVQDASCYGSMDGSIDLDITGGEGPYSLSWNNGATDTLLSNLDPGVYIVEAQDDQGCIRIDTFEVSEGAQIQVPEISPLSWTAPLPGPELICPGSDTVLLQAAPAPPGFSYQWYDNNQLIPGATGQQLAVSQPGVFRVEYSGTPCNSALSDAIVVPLADDLPVPEIQNNGPAVLCPGDEALLQVLNVSPAFSLQWFFNNEPIPGETDVELTVTEAGVYSVQFQYEACVLSMSALSEITSELEPVGLGLLFENDTLSVSTGAWTAYQWLLDGAPIPGAVNATYVPAENGFYECQVISDNGCAYQVGMQVIVTSTALPNSVRQFNLSPNPTSGIVQLTMQLRRSERVNLILQDAQQRQLLTKSVKGQRITTEFDLSQLPGGTYYLRVQLESGSILRPVVRN